MSDKNSTWLSDKSEGTLIRFKSPTDQIGGVLGMKVTLSQRQMARQFSTTQNVHEKAGIRTDMLTVVIARSAGFAHQMGHEHTLPAHRQSHLSNVSNHGIQLFCLHTGLLAVYCSIKQEVDLL